MAAVQARLHDASCPPRLPWPAARRSRALPWLQCLVPARPTTASVVAASALVSVSAAPPPFAPAPAATPRPQAKPPFHASGKKTLEPAWSSPPAPRHWLATGRPAPAADRGTPVSPSTSSGDKSQCYRLGGFMSFERGYFSICSVAVCSRSAEPDSSRGSGEGEKEVSCLGRQVGPSRHLPNCGTSSVRTECRPRTGV